MQYRDGDLVLRNVSFEVASGSRVPGCGDPNDYEHIKKMTQDKGSNMDKYGWKHQDHKMIFD